jgi:hypothetical protein
VRIRKMGCGAQRLQGKEISWQIVLSEQRVHPARRSSAAGARGRGDGVRVLAASGSEEKMSNWARSATDHGGHERYRRQTR